MEVVEKSPTRVRLEFFAITGKVYALERSDDGQTWKRVPFTTSEEADAEALGSYRATSVGILPAFCAPSDATDKEFFRLTVR